MSQNNKDILINTIVNLFVFGLTASPLFEDMNLFRFLLIGFGIICILTPFVYWNNGDEE